ncbi:MAG: hypothetical protein HY294_01625 [Candidatus Rokubacteria bacterium]|nr:hypothetical protein [Candidatus Rokubacteria bacterium]
MTKVFAIRASRRAVLVMALLLAAAVTAGCTQVSYYVPEQSRPYALRGWPRNIVGVEVVDYRPQPEQSEALAARIRQIVESSLSPADARSGERYALRVAVTEHQAFLTDRVWLARTQLRVSLLDGAGSPLRHWVAVGQAARGNLFGRTTANDASRDAFQLAMADLIAQLDSEPPARN